MRRCWNSIGLNFLIFLLLCRVWPSTLVVYQHRNIIKSHLHGSKKKKNNWKKKSDESSWFRGSKLVKCDFYDRAKNIHCAFLAVISNDQLCLHRGNDPWANTFAIYNLPGKKTFHLPTTTRFPLFPSYVFTSQHHSIVPRSMWLPLKIGLGISFDLATKIARAKFPLSWLNKTFFPFTQVFRIEQSNEYPWKLKWRESPESPTLLNFFSPSSI